MMISNWLVANWFGIIGLLAGLLFSFFIYLKQKKEKRPVFASRNISIIRNSKDTFPLLQVHFKGHGNDIENLSATVIAIWNAGRETLRGDDVASTKPLVIRAVREVKLLGATVIQQNNSASVATCKFNKITNEALLQFEYLDYREGFVVEVLHTGTTKASIEIEGKFKGCGDIQAINDSRRSSITPFLTRLINSRKRRERQPIIYWMAFLIFTYMTMLIITIYTLTFNLPETATFQGKHYIPVPSSYYVGQDDKLHRNATFYVFPIVFFLCFTGLTGINLWVGYNSLRNDLPAGLSQYAEHLR